MKDYREKLVMGVLCAEVQDKMMSVAKEYQFEPILMITEQTFNRDTRTLTLKMTTYLWKEHKWSDKSRTQVIPEYNGAVYSFHNFYWSLEVAEVYLSSGARFNDFEHCAEAALGWEIEGEYGNKYQTDARPYFVSLS